MCPREHVNVGQRAMREIGFFPSVWVPRVRMAMILHAGFLPVWPKTEFLKKNLASEFLFLILLLLFIY